MPKTPDYVVDCPSCNTKAVVVVSATHDYPDPEYGFVLHYLVAHCRLCFQVMFLMHEADEEDPQHNARVLWPQRERTLSTTIPEELRLEHAEARTCFRHGAYTATVVMVRRTLEGVCAKHDIKERTLLKALGQMKEQGVIDGRLLEWAQALRVLGNEGAHFTGHRVARPDAEDALALGEAILDYLYVFSFTFALFELRRKARVSGSADESTLAAKNQNSVSAANHGR